MSRPRNLESLLNSGLGRVVERAKALLRIEQLVTGQMDPAVASHCRVANVNGDLLILQVDSPAWAGRLRHQLPQLGAALQRYSELRQIEQIRVIVRPQERRATRSTPAEPLSAKSAAEIDAAADSIGDSELSAALHRLARHHR